MSRNLGWKRDPAKWPGERPDLHAAHLLGAAPVPASASARQHILSVLDQEYLSSCVANAGMQAIRAGQHREGVEHPELGSRLFAYFLARATHHATDKDEGTFVRAFFDVISKLGFPPEHAWPYLMDRVGGQARVFTMPGSDAFRQAYDQRSPISYHRIYETGDDRVLQIKRAVAQERCVVFGATVTSAFVDDVYGKDPAPLPQPGDQIAGGHAMTIAEYNELGVRGPNSWGTGWGNDGWFNLSWEYVASSMCDDFWIVDVSPRFA